MEGIIDLGSFGILHVVVIIVLVAGYFIVAGWGKRRFK